MKRILLTLLCGGITVSAAASVAPVTEPAEVTGRASSSTGAVTSTSSVTDQSDEARLLRFPATNGTDVVFSYAGDLFTAPLAGGEARRLTSHIGYEMFAHYSPDGKTIAFTGEYDGNREVYVIPARGGEPVRLTYTATNGRDDLGDRMGPNNIVMGWTPDGKNIIFRNRTGDGFSGKLWTAACPDTDYTIRNQITQTFPRTGSRMHFLFFPTKTLPAYASSLCDVPKNTLFVPSL